MKQTFKNIILCYVINVQCRHFTKGSAHYCNFDIKDSVGSRNFHKWGPIDCLRGARSSQASVIPYMSNQLFPKKMGRARLAPFKFNSERSV